MRRPNLFIVGAARCGTTAMYQYLRGHPDIFMSPRKEPHHFSTDLDRGGEKEGLFFTRDLEEYLALFEAAGDERWVGEASTTYLYSEGAPARIREFEPDARIVVSLRNPIELIHSLHTERVASGAEDIVEFGPALEAEEDRRAGRRLPHGAFHAGGYLYRDRARFSDQLARYLDVFPREHVHVVIFEDLARDTPAVFRRLLEFLDVDSTYQPSSFEPVNSAKRSRSRALAAALHWPTGRMVARRVVPGRLQPPIRSVIRPLRAFNRPAAPRAPIAARLRRELEAEYAADVERVSQMIGRDLGEVWFRPAAAGVGGR